ncbi:MAG TPA: hypothetical protein VJ914_41205 [Pseudonocardiaceae bacterium]|nr:hypothetical protein [Pseudonocardiaceae bacterium]
MTDSSEPLVDPGSKESIAPYYESWDKASAKAHSPAGYAGAAGSYLFMKGDDYKRPDGTDLAQTGWATGIPVSDDMMGMLNSGSSLLSAGDAVVHAVEQGQWPTTKQLVAAIAAAAGVVASDVAVQGDMATAADPIGMGVQWAVSWLCNHFRPLRAALDGLIGNTDVINAYAQSWSNIAEYIAGIGRDLGKTYRDGMGAWRGPAYAAYLGMATTVLAALDACAKSAASMSTLITGLGELVAGVHALVVSAIADAASELLDAIETFCGFEEQAASGTEGKIAELLAQVAKLTESCGKTADTVANVLPVVASLVGILSQVGGTYAGS